MDTTGRRSVAAVVGRWTALCVAFMPLAPGAFGTSSLPVGATPRPAAASAASAATVGADANVAGRGWIEMRNVDLRLADQVVIRVRSLDGEVLRTHLDRPPALDDATSYRIRVTAGTVALTGDDLGALLNTVVFAYPHAPLRDLRMRTDGLEIVETGIIHKGVDLRFRLRGTIDLMADGRVRIHPSAVHILGFNGQGILHVLGLHLESLLDLRGAHGASVKGDDLFLDPTAILPPPIIDGHLASVRIKDDAVIQEFVRLADDSVFHTFVHPDTVDHNFIYFHGGQLRFGKLLMTDTDVQIVGSDRGATFDMSLPHYSRQLVAGRSRTMANQGLVVYLPNFASVRESDANHALSSAGDVAVRSAPPAAGSRAGSTHQ